MTQPDTLPITFDRKCETAQDFARRYRVLASMSEGGIQFTMKPAELRAMADLFEGIAKRPALVIIEKEKPLPAPIAMFMALGAAAQVVMIGEIVARILWGLA